MRIVLENEFELDQRVFTVVKKSKTVYKPCSLCNNTRRVSVKDGDTEYSVECPKCSGKRVKGDETFSVSIEQCSVMELSLSNITISVRGDVRYYFRPVDGSYSRTVEGNLEYIRTLIQQGTMFLDKKTCLAEVKRLNKIEVTKAEEFLGTVNAT